MCETALVLYVCRGGSLAATLSRLCPASLTGAGAGLLVVQRFVGQRPVPVATDGKVPVEAVPEAVSISYPVIYQVSVFVLTELTDQLGLQGCDRRKQRFSVSYPGRLE